MSARRPSVAGRLLVAQGAPLILLAIALLAWSVVTAWQVVERTSDRLLAGSLMAIQAGVSVAESRPHALIEPWALGLLDSPDRDAVYYAVYNGGVLLTGYDELKPSLRGVSETPAFRYGTIKGIRVREAEKALRMPGVEAPITIIVAQTLDSRRSSYKNLLFNLIIIPTFLLSASVLLIRPAIKWSLYPAKNVAEQVTKRSDVKGRDFTIIPLEGIPRELDPFVLSVNGLLKNLHNAITSSDRFSSDASHQLRTPLAVIVANLSLMGEGEKTESRLALINDSREAASRLQRVLAQLISLSRSEIVSEREFVSLNSIVSRSVQEFIRINPDADILEKYSDPDIVVKVDLDLAVEMFLNVIGNAASHGGSRTVVRVGRSGSGGVVHIWDNGPGVDADFIGDIFNRFQRGMRASSGGSGLGLSIVKSIADSHGIDVVIRNRPNQKGLWVSFYF